MKKTLTAIALYTTLGMGAASAIGVGVGAGVGVGPAGVGAGVAAGIGAPSMEMGGPAYGMGRGYGMDGGYGMGGGYPLHAGHNEGLQNYYYYFGAPCCNRPFGGGAPCPATAAAPCGAVPTPCGPCGTCPPLLAPIEYESVCTCCDPCGNNGLFGFGFFGL